MGILWVSFVSYIEKKDREISGAHCIRIITLPMIHISYNFFLWISKRVTFEMVFIKTNILPFRVTKTWAISAKKTFDTNVDRSSAGFSVDLTRSVVKYYINLERLPAYYLLNIIIPAAVLAFLSASTFYVPVDSGEKLSLSITILLSFSVFLLILSDNTPNISQDLPYLGKLRSMYNKLAFAYLVLA